MKNLLKVLVTVVVTGLIIWQVGDVGNVGRLMKTMDPFYAFLGLVFSTFSRALMTYKWGLLLRGRSHHLPFLRGMKIYCASSIWGMFLPATVGADAVRAIRTARSGLDSTEVFASIVIERMIGFLTVLLLGLLGLILLSVLGVGDSRFGFVWWLGGAVVVSFIIGLVASFNRTTFDLVHTRLLRRFYDNRFVRKFRQVHLTYQAYQNNKKNLFTFFVLTIVEQFVRIFYTWLIAHGLNIEVDLLFLAGVVPLTLLISRIPISMSGWGLSEGAFLILMSLAGIPPTESIAISIVNRIVQIISWLPWWLAEVMNSGTVRPCQVLPEQG